jgi:hypothetical protein
MASARRLGSVDYAMLPAFSVLVIFGSWIGYQRILQERAAATLALRTATLSDAVKGQLGTPLKMGIFVTGHLFLSGGDTGTADLRIPISGPKGEGTLIEWAQSGFAGWHLCSLILRPTTGADLVLVPDESSKCERE